MDFETREEQPYAAVKATVTTQTFAKIADRLPEVMRWLVAPGDPESSLIFLRADTAEAPLRMPPLGRNRVDRAYVELLRSWISSLTP